MEMRNVIWIASYPKSGNNWMSTVVSTAGAKYGFPKGPLGIYHIKGAEKRPEPCPAVADRFLADGPCSVLKTHAAHVAGEKVLHALPGMKLVTAGFVHIYRNPLDVLLSYINFSRIVYEPMADNEEFRKGFFVDLMGFDQPVDYADWRTTSLDDIPRKNLDHALMRFSDNGLEIPTLSRMSGAWPDHVRSWLAASATIPGVNLRYEDCIEDPERIVEVASLFRFSEDDVRAAVKEAAGRARRGAEGGDDRQSIKYNKMRSYYFADYFSKPVVEKFVAANEATLREFGYPDLLSRM